MSYLSIDRVDGIEICFVLARGVQIIYETNEVRIKTSRSEGHKSQATDKFIALKKVVSVAMFFDHQRGKQGASKGLNLSTTLPLDR